MFREIEFRLLRRVALIGSTLMLASAASSNASAANGVDRIHSVLSWSSMPAQLRLQDEPRAIRFTSVADSLNVLPLFPALSAQSTWIIYTYNRHSDLLPSPAWTIPGGLAGFPLSADRWTALLTTSGSTGGIQLTGNLVGRTIHTRLGLTMAVGAAAFRYLGQPDPCRKPVSARVFLATDADYSPATTRPTNYWWSNPTAVRFSTLASHDEDVAVRVQPGDWSDASGHFSSSPDQLSAFATAMENVHQIGLSFGGGCYFDNGVQPRSKTAIGMFRLMRFSID